LAAVDCTGHGVPGAFMSMMSNQILNEIIEQKHIHHADKILNELNRILYYSLKKRNAETTSIATHAGMDLALCVIDKKNLLLEYAGAMNPIYFIKNGEFHEIKADKQAIGGADGNMDKRFNIHYISLREPTTFYICSDGFQDQFGGNQGKKFMVKRLKSLLLSIHDLPMAEQKSILERELIDWQGKEEQVDDILLIGFCV
jgi:serine phosphatase RsbU (regulator of sigma subunit)